MTRWVVHRMRRLRTARSAQDTRRDHRMRLPSLRSTDASEAALGTGVEVRGATLERRRQGQIKKRDTFLLPGYIGVPSASV